MLLENEQFDMEFLVPNLKLLNSSLITVLFKRVKFRCQTINLHTNIQVLKMVLGVLFLLGHPVLGKVIRMLEA